MSRRNLLWMLAVPAVVVVGLAVTASAPQPSDDYKLLRTLVDVLAEVDKNYVRPLTPEEKRKLVENMINGGLEKLVVVARLRGAGRHRQADGHHGRHGQHPEQVAT